MALRGTWIAEAALWSHWIHVGKLEAETGSQLMTVSASDLLGLLPRHQSIAHTTRYYGRAFHLRIVAAMPPHAHFPSDLHVPFTDPSDLLSGDIGLGLLQAALEDGLLVLEDEDRLVLEEEVQSEKCAIIQRQNGELERVVAVSAMQLYHPFDSAILMEVGKWKPGDGVKSKCLLPGCKRCRGELPHDTIAKLLDTDLAQFARGIRMEGSEDEIEVKESERFVMQTRYLRTVHHARLDPEFPLEDHLLHSANRQVELYGCLDKGKVVLYAWVALQDVDFMRSPEAVAVLKNMAEGVEDACARLLNGSATVNLNQLAPANASHHLSTATGSTGVRGYSRGLSPNTKSETI